MTDLSTAVMAKLFADAVGMPAPADGYEAVKRAIYSAPCLIDLIPERHLDELLAYVAYGWDGVTPPSASLDYPRSYSRLESDFRKYFQVGRLAKEMHERIPRA